MDYAYRHGVATAIDRLGLTKTAFTMPSMPAGAEEYLSKILPVLKDTARGAGYGAVSGGLGGLVSSRDDDAESALSRAGRGMVAGGTLGAAGNALTHGLLHGAGALKSKFGPAAARAEHAAATEALRNQMVLDREIFGNAYQQHKEHLAKPQLDEIERTLGLAVDEAQERLHKLHDAYYPLSDLHEANPTAETAKALAEHENAMAEARRQQTEALRAYRNARKDAMPIVKPSDYPEDLKKLYEAAHASGMALGMNPAFDPGMRGYLEYLPDASMLGYMPMRVAPASLGFARGRMLESPKKREEER